MNVGVNFVIKPNSASIRPVVILASVRKACKFTSVYFKLLAIFSSFKPLEGFEYKGSKCKERDCPTTWTKISIDKQRLCYKDFGRHYLVKAHLMCTENDAWLLVPRNARENNDFKNLLKSLNLSNYGAALGLRLKVGRTYFVDRNGKRPVYRNGLL